MHAASQGYAVETELLLRQPGVDITRSDIAGLTALDYALGWTIASIISTRK